jgi:hypothetical protein
MCNFLVLLIVKSVYLSTCFDMHIKKEVLTSELREDAVAPSLYDDSALNSLFTQYQAVNTHFWSHRKLL